MSTIKNEMLSVEDVSTALKISKSQVYKVLKKNKNIIKPMIKVDGKTYISNDGIKYIEEVFNKTITTISVDKDINISLEEVAVTSNTSNIYEDKSLEDIKLKNFINDKVINEEIKNNKTISNLGNTANKGIDEIKIITPNDDKTNNENIYITSIDFKDETIFKEEEIQNKTGSIKTLSQEESLKKKEEELLDKHCKEIDSKLIELKEKLIEKQELNKKGFFKKVFSNIFK